MTNHAAGLKKHLSGLAGNRLYLSQLPAKCPLPAISYFPVTDSVISDLQGEAGLSHQRWQIDCWHRRYDALNTLAAQVMERMASMDGCLRTGRSESFEQLTGLYRVSLEYSLWSYDAPPDLPVRAPRGSRAG